VAATSDEKLNQPLLQFHEESTAELQLLAVNFDPALVRLLKETKYFLLLGVQVCYVSYACLFVVKLATRGCRGRCGQAAHQARPPCPCAACTKSHFTMLSRVVCLKCSRQWQLQLFANGAGS
jgi:hypothetical protein